MNNPHLTIEPVDNSQLITDSEDEKVRKQNKCAAKKKGRLNNICTPLRAPAAGSAALLLSCPTLVSRLGSSALLLSCLRSPTHLSPLAACLEIPTVLLSYLMLAPVHGSPAVFLLLPVVGPTPPHLASTAFRTFQQDLSDKFLRYSISPAEFLCPFPPFGLLPDKTNHKRTFNIAFINSCPFAGNHAQEEADLSFAGCGCPAAVKLNRLWQLEPPDPKPICIMQAIFLAAVIF